MGSPTWQTLDEVKIEIDSFTDSWSLYGEYAKELDAMVNESWLAFRAHILTFDDFGKKWVGKLKGRAARDSVYDYLSREVKGHQEIFPILRKVTGQLFEREHWSLLFAKLKFPPTVTTKTLTLGDFLNARDAMRACERDIDHLVARAQGEVSIREAVQELKTWASQSEFALLDHKTNHGVATVLIKEWKDLFTKVSDQQSLVASLKDSPYFAPFAEEAMLIANKLGILDEVLHQMNQIQRKWVCYIAYSLINKFHSPNQLIIHINISPRYRL
jgi:dynein heavy chain 2